MRTCILYVTTHGCVEKCVHELQEKLSVDVDLFNLKKNPPKNLADYERIIIGGSIHAGHVQQKIKTFCDKNEALLMKKNVGLFLCCMEEGEKAQEQFDNAYPESLRQHAIAIGLFGGEFDFNKMGFLAKAIVKKIANIEKSVDKISHKSIAEFAAQMK